MVSNFSLIGAVGLLADINILIKMSANNKRHSEEFGHELVASTEKSQQAALGAIDEIKSIVPRVDNMLRLMKSSHVANAKDRLAFWSESKEQKWDDLFQRACNLRDAMIIEFKDYLFFAYSKEKGQRVKTWEVDWGKAIAAFPEVRMEVHSAVDCYALQHPTASVFHSMRIAECGLRALAKERRVTLPKNKAIEWATWQEIIKALDDEIRAIGGTWKAGGAKDSALAFYSGARADLNGFKDEYRNLVMHVRGQNDEFQALRALTQVHAFMERVAERIDHRHHRIRWGRS